MSARGCPSISVKDALFAGPARRTWCQAGPFLLVSAGLWPLRCPVSQRGLEIIRFSSRLGKAQLAFCTFHKAKIGLFSREVERGAMMG